MGAPIHPFRWLVGLALLMACSGNGDDGGPTGPRFPEVAGTYDIEQPRTGGTCETLEFVPFRAVVTQDDDEVVITQTEPVPFIPYVGTLEEDGDFEAGIARQPALGEGIEAESDVQGRFASRGLTAREVLTVHDAGASDAVRSDVGLPSGRSSCTHVLDWQGDQVTTAARRLPSSLTTSRGGPARSHAKVTAPAN